MEILFLILFILVVIHYIYDKILLPSVRQRLRGEIFEQRDLLRREVIKLEAANSLNEVSKKTFKQVDDVINRSVNRLHMLTISNIYKAKSNITNTDIHRIEKFHKLLEASPSNTPEEVYKNVNKLMSQVLVANSLLLCLYALPVALLVMLTGLLVKNAKALPKDIKDLKGKYIEVVQTEPKPQFNKAYC
jgi:hypothetical protein